MILFDFFMPLVGFFLMKILPKNSITEETFYYYHNCCIIVRLNVLTLCKIGGQQHIYNAFVCKYADVLKISKIVKTSNITIKISN